MTRYQVLRQLDVDRLSSAFIAVMNWMMNTPAHEIRFMHVVIEFDPDEEPQ